MCHCDLDIRILRYKDDYKRVEVALQFLRKRHLTVFLC